MSDNTISKMITLKSDNGKEFVVPETVAKQSNTICDVILHDTCPMNFIPIPNVTAPILEKVIEYCKKHVDAADASKTEDSIITQASSKISDEELRNWDKQFLDVDMETLFSLTNAASDLGIEGLLDATCQTVADMIRGKSTEEIRQIFNIKNDYTPEEEEKIRCDHPWIDY